MWPHLSFVAGTECSWKHLVLVLSLARVVRALGPMVLHLFASTSFAMCVAPMRTDASAALRREPARSSFCTRRSLLASGSAFAIGLTAMGGPAVADGLSSDFVGLPKYAEPRADSPLSKQRDSLSDPFAAARQSDPNRARRFADELPPMSAAERRQAQQKAAEEIWSLENKARPGALVSKQATAPAIGGSTSLDDEFTLEFDSSKPIGLKLKDLRVGFELGTTAGTSRVLVSDVAPGGQAASTGRIEIDMIVVAVDGVNVEKASAKDVSQQLARAKAESRVVKVTFKDALAFNERLASRPGATEEAMAPVSTKIAPGGSDEPEQVLTIQRLEVAERCTRNANAGDLVEIRYTGRLADGTVFDGMELADRFGDDSLQFVLGRQPAGQFPPAWDIGLQGMCVGERRLVDVPPALGFGAKGLPKRGVPPNARLLYDVELLAINALSTP